ncbi:putative glycosyl hydrolase [Actinoplanes missouriensis 431]|uniref:Putative glycosyl hydrolase n=1 Tax=Actinoplanes missouriensis (strain ATCC 14538 / DSM 43046 / CBS 188.64 / JCM 3121 / NBRC 102363 / NCIMB 12654 / NRRL B-3342 / UNCC 431) TaxID=512565 RepID=I0H7W2_ACTM4|nr:discoidin domain-containing protein [Actinoplanes missouriensis]BAL89099.1 putative glycosyl hydrolase [Actinoplanes missouriensis 431]
MRRLLLPAALTGLLTAFLVVPAAVPAAAAEVLVSQNKPATASSSEWAGTPAAAAVDGDNGTRWSSAFAATQWFQVDLGASTAVSRVAINWEAAYAKAFTLQLSDNGTTWTNAYATTTATGGRQSIPLSGTARYVRLNLTQRALEAYGYSFWEFQVYAGSTTTPGGGGLLSYAKPARASSEQNDPQCNPCTADKAFDNDPASRWATSPTTGWVDPGWIQVDLGATAQISQVVLQWDPAYARAYQIQVSGDGTTWSTIYATTTGDGLKDVVNASGTGRYVRMYGTARSSTYGYSLWEFSVYGTGGSPAAPPAKPADPVFPAARLVFADEFNGAAGSKPDTAKWTYDPGVPQNGEVQYYTPNSENASMNGTGQLVVEARRQDYQGRQYTSHRMNTSTTFHVQYGRIEARIKVPKGNGLWPAFWMMGEDFLQGRPWPYNGEIDIMEVLGRNTSEAYSTLHAPAYNGAGGYGQRYATADLSQDFHTWAAEWDSKGIRFFLDNALVFTADKETVENTRGPWIYDHKFYLILNLAVGGDFPGPIDTTTPFPSRMLVDYVRVYQ